jgi:hypothetical protein
LFYLTWPGADDAKIAFESADENRSNSLSKVEGRYQTVLIVY